MNFHTLNMWAVFVATVSAFLVGSIWYSPLLLGTAWKRANGFAADPPKASPKTFALSLLFCLVMALNLAMFLNDPKTTIVWGATAGFLAGFGWVAMSIGVISLFESRPWSYIFINGGYVTVALSLMGAILGSWRR